MEALGFRVPGFYGQEMRAPNWLLGFWIVAAAAGIAMATAGVVVACKRTLNPQPRNPKS